MLLPNAPQDSSDCGQDMFDAETNHKTDLWCRAENRSGRSTSTTVNMIAEKDGRLVIPFPVRAKGAWPVLTEQNSQQASVFSAKGTDARRRI